DSVVDGEKREPYVEMDRGKPISVDGESKRGGEGNVLSAVGDAVSVPIGKQAASPTVVRVSWVFGPDRPSFIDAMIKRAREEEKIEAIVDKWSTPTYTADIAEMLPRLFEVDAGILHLPNFGECSWQEYAQHALDCCHALGMPLKAKTVGALKLSDMTRLRQS